MASTGVTGEPIVDSAARVVTLAVGSLNPVKITAAVSGTERALSGQRQDLQPQQQSIRVESVGFNVPSGVADQPIGDDVTKTGSINRAKAAFDAFVSERGVAPTFAVGMEGGVAVSSSDELECFAYMSVYDGSRVGTARTGTFVLPARFRDLVLKDGMELGHADDLVFGTSNSKQKAGSVGQLTNGVIDRAAFYEHALILAFIPFHWRDMYAPSVGANCTTTKGDSDSNNSSSN